MASGSTTNYQLPYPISTDQVNVAGDIQDLSEKLDLFLTNPDFINNIYVDGGSITTSSLIANIFNSNATTLNVGGAATILNIGNASGQTNFAGDINLATGKNYEINNVVVLNATTLGSSVVNSSLTSVGTITTGTWSATTIAVDKGGTGVTTSTGTGSVVLSESPTFTGNPVAPTQTFGDSSTSISTTEFVQIALSNIDVLPDQSGHSGEYLTTDGTTPSWETISVPSVRIDPIIATFLFN